MSQKKHDAVRQRRQRPEDARLTFTSLHVIPQQIKASHRMISMLCTKQLGYVWVHPEDTITCCNVVVADS